MAIAVYQLAFFAAVDRTGVAVGTVVALGSAPAIAGVTGRLIDGEPLTGRWAAATALACAGVLLLVLGGGGASVDALGIMLAVVSGTGYATYTVLAKRMLRLGHAPERVMAASFSLGALLLVPVLVLGDVSLAGQRRRARAGAVPRRDPDRARLRPVRARPAPPDARRDRDADARRAADRHRPRRSSRWASAPARSPRSAPALVLAGLLVLAAAGRPAAGAAARGGAGMSGRLALQRVSTVDAIAAALRTRILDGELGAGERLRELELAEAYGVARHSLRAALRALAAEGLVVIEPNRGARVAALTRADLLALFELRLALELEAAHLALERHDGRLPKPVHDAVRLMAAVCEQPDPPWSAVVDAHDHVHSSARRRRAGARAWSARTRR